MQRMNEDDGIYERGPVAPSEAPGGAGHPNRRSTRQPRDNRWSRFEEGLMRRCPDDEEEEVELTTRTTCRITEAGG